MSGCLKTPDPFAVFLSSFILHTRGLDIGDKQVRAILSYVLGCPSTTVMPLKPTFTEVLILPQILVIQLTIGEQVKVATVLRSETKIVHVQNEASVAPNRMLSEQRMQLEINCSVGCVPTSKRHTKRIITSYNLSTTNQLGHPIQDFEGT